MDKKSEVNEIVKTNTISTKKTKRKENLLSGADLVDLVLGGGFPYGIVNIVGDSSSGKSFLSGEFIAKALFSAKDGIEWFYDDVEKGYKFNTPKLYGLDILNKGLLPQKKRSHTIEDFENNLQDILDKKEKGKPFIYVLDSFDALTTEDEMKHRKKKIASRKKKKEDSDTDTKENGSYNLSKQKENHAIFRTRVREIEENNMILIAVSQVKEKIGVSFGAKTYRTGGKSLDFYPNIVFWLAEVERYMKQGRPVGICVKVRGTKTRNDKPFRTCFIDILFDYGIDNVSSNLKFLYDLKTGLGKDIKKIEKKEPWLAWDNKDYTYLELLAHIEDNDLEEELKIRTAQKWNDIEKEISSDNRKRKWGNI